MTRKATCKLATFPSRASAGTRVASNLARAPRRDGGSSASKFGRPASSARHLRELLALVQVVASSSSSTLLQEEAQIIW